MRRLPLMVLTVVLLTGSTPALAHAISAPLTGNPRSAGGALARGTALATSFPLPTGLRWTTKPTRLTARSDVQATQTLVVRRLARGTHAVTGLIDFFRTHPPKGMVLSAGFFNAKGGENDYATKTTTDTSAELQYSFVGKELQLQLDVRVGWTPARPADTLLPGGLKEVTVEVWPGESFGEPVLVNFKHQVIHASGPALQPLVDYLNGLAVPGPFGFGAGSCPIPRFYGSNPRFTFHTPQHLVVFQYVADDCGAFNVSVDGKHRPALYASFEPIDPTQLVMIQLLHLVHLVP
jgi:hypothetical protein